MSPGGFDLFDAAFVETDAVISGGGFEGTFDVDDPELKGQVRVKTERRHARSRRQGRGGGAGQDPSRPRSPRLSLRPGLGRFPDGRQAGGVQEFSGSFTSPEITGYGEKAGRVSGRLEWKDGVLSFPELAMDFYGGRFDGRLLVGIVNGEFDFDLRGEELDFARSSRPRPAGCPCPWPAGASSAGTSWAGCSASRT